MGVVDRVGIGSFNYTRTKGVAEGVGGQERVWTALGPIGAVALKTNLMTGYLAQTEAAGFQLLFGSVSSGMVESAHQHGLDVHVWTPNTAEDMAAALDKGVDGVMTDNIHDLKTVMQNRGIWRA